MPLEAKSKLHYTVEYLHLGALYMIPFDRDGCFAEIRFYKEYT